MIIDVFGVAVTIDLAFAAVTAAAIGAGLARGFAGFGSALIMVPVASAAYGPTVGIPMFLIVDALVTTPYFVTAARRCDWPEMLPIALAAIVTAPIGVLFLKIIDPTIIRWMICLIIFAMVIVLATGWRYRKAASRAAGIAVGAASGLSGGMTGLAGPPVILFWLGGQSDPQRVRTNNYVFFGLITIGVGFGLFMADLFTASTFAHAGLLAPGFALAQWLGARGFSRSNDTLFRRIALILCAISAVVGLPALDRLF